MDVSPNCTHSRSGKELLKGWLEKIGHLYVEWVCSRVPNQWDSPLGQSICLSFFKMGSHRWQSGTSQIEQAWIYDTHLPLPPKYAQMLSKELFLRQCGYLWSNVQEAEPRGSQVQGQRRLHLESHANLGQKSKTCLEIYKQTSSFLTVS